MLLDIQVDVEGGPDMRAWDSGKRAGLRCTFEGPSRWTVCDTLELNESTQEVQTEQTKGQDWALERARTLKLGTSRSTHQRRVGGTARICDENQQSVRSCEGRAVNSCWELGKARLTVGPGLGVGTGDLDKCGFSQRSGRR